MTVVYRYLVYPDGDRQETDIALRINQLVDLNGFPLPLPLTTVRQIVYRVTKIRNTENRGEESSYYYLELVTGDELNSLARGR